MTREEIREALLEDTRRAKEVRTNDGRIFRVDGVEQWALGGARLVILEGAGQSTLSIRNIASIGPAAARRRRA
ncbi:MAG TPA: hypothetical protein VF950_29590 [Planctomycetota bacterium]